MLPCISWTGGLLKFQRAQSGALLDPMLPEQCMGLRQLHKMSETISGICLSCITLLWRLCSLCCTAESLLLDEKTKKISSKNQHFMPSCTTIFRWAKRVNATKGCCVESSSVLWWAVPRPALLWILHMPSPFSNQMSTVSARLIASARCIKQRRLSGAHASNHIVLGERASLILWEDANWPDVMPTSLSEWQ